MKPRVPARGEVLEVRVKVLSNGNVAAVVDVDGWLNKSPLADFPKG